MTLAELAEQYKKECEVTKKRIEVRKKQLKYAPPTDVIRLKREMLILHDMLHDLAYAASTLEHYYDK